MENRFTVKDFFLFILLAVLIAVVVGAMFQFDRQWTDVRKVRDKLDEQGRDLQDLKRTLARASIVGTKEVGVPTTSPAVASTNPADYPNDPDARVKAAHALSGYAEGDWIVDTSMGGIAKLTPFISSDLYATRIQEYVLETLLSLDQQSLEYRPALATALPKVEDNVAAYEKFVDEQTKAGKKLEDIQKDPKLPIPVILTFTVRTDARFSDGVPVTPEDFIWTFNWIMNEKVAAPRERSSFEKIRSVERQGEHELVFKFREPYYDVIMLASSLPALPKHFYEQFAPEKYNQSVGLLMGSGPYRMEDPKSWKPGGDSVVLVRNDRYWGTSPAFDRIIYKEISIDVARQTAFRNGEIDVLESRPEQFHTMIQEPALMKRAQAHHILSLNGGYRFVSWQEKKNDKPTPFADKRVRRAMTMLVNLERLRDELTYGYSTLATGPFSPVSKKQFDPSVKRIPYDVEAAKKLLAEAGFKDSQGDGVLHGPDGNAFRFKLTYPSGNAAYERCVLSMKDAYASAGILLEPEPLEWAVFTQKLNTKDFDAIMLGWGGGSPEADIYQMFDSSQSVADGDNFMWYSNPRVDELIRKARVTVDPAKRLPLWQEIQRLIYDDQPYMFMWFTEELFLLDKRIQNVHAGPLGLPSVDRLEWFVPRNSQKWTK